MVAIDTRASDGTMSSTVTTKTEAASPAAAKPFFNDFSRHPPTEKFMTIDGLLRSHAAEPDQTPLICFPYQGVSDFEQHTAKDIDRYVDLAVQFHTRHGLQPAVKTFLLLRLVDVDILTESYRMQQTVQRPSLHYCRPPV